MIEFKNVSKTYDNKQYAMSNINIKIEKRWIQDFSWSSGAGKSTFIKLLLREVEATSGTIILGDTIVNRTERIYLTIEEKLEGGFPGFLDWYLLYSYIKCCFCYEGCGGSLIGNKKKVPMALSMVGLSSKFKQFP